MATHLSILSGHCHGQRSLKSYSQWGHKKLDTTEHTPEKAMAAHSSALAWKIPWGEEPGGLQSMGSRRVRHDWATSLSLFTFMHWRRKWQPTPVFLPGESQGRGSLVGCRLWGRTESGTTEATQQRQQQSIHTPCIWFLVGQKVCLGFSIISHEKPKQIFWPTQSPCPTHSLIRSG